MDANINSLQRVNNERIPATTKNNLIKPAETFGNALSRAVDLKAVELRFSKHASIRLNSREVDLSADQIKRVEEGVSRAIAKGVSDSLVLVDGYALVVNTGSRTVVTAIGNTKDKIFTNIDGAVIV